MSDDPNKRRLREALEAWQYWELRARDLEGRVDVYLSQNDALALLVEQLRERLRALGAP